MKSVRMMLAASLLAVSPALAQAPADTPPVELDFLAGDWDLFDPGGAKVGTSRVTVQAPGALLFEERKVGSDGTQPLWFVNSERDGGWIQLFIGPKNQARAFVAPRGSAAWPLELGADVVLANGTPARFKMTISRVGDQGTRRVLLMSRDNGATWSRVFDYEYRRPR